MTFVGLPLKMVADRGHNTLIITSGWFDAFYGAARQGDFAASRATLDNDGFWTGVAGSIVTGRWTFMFMTIQNVVTDLENEPKSIRISKDE